jgi:hypothetical protein
MPKPTLPPQATPSPPTTRRRYVWRRAKGATVYLYYRRAGVLLPLPGPEGSEAFRLAYERAQAAFGDASARGTTPLHTVHDAITHYLASADYRELAPRSRADYRRLLDTFRSAFGSMRLATFTEPAIEKLRAKYAPDQAAGKPGRAIEWNALRSRMISVVREYRRHHPDALASNPWEASRRLKVEPSRQNRPWPPELLRAVLQAATPEFRALLIAYLMTAQRGGDVTRFEAWQYDAEAATLNLCQEKTGEPMLIHVPGHLARALEAMAGRHPTRLLVTPRGKPWQLANAQETLATLLRTLRLPRHTLHGLRATGPVALKMLGFENRAIRALTGHTSDRNLETYLAGVEHYPLARVAQEALQDHFGDLLAALEPEANRRRYAGVTGRAAAKARAAE